MYDRVFMLETSGPTLALVRERIDHLPNFRRFLERGAWSKLEGPLQPVLATSYAAFSTGKNPGKTGFFDSFRFPAGSYDRIPYIEARMGFLWSAGSGTTVMEVPGLAWRCGSTACCSS